MGFYVTCDVWVGFPVHVLFFYNVHVTSFNDIVDKKMTCVVYILRCDGYYASERFEKTL
jgi:hypothetical protein